MFSVDLPAVFLLLSLLSSSCASHPECTALQTGLWIKLRYRDPFFSTDQALVRECRQVLYFSVFIDYTFEVGCWLAGLNIVLSVASCGHLFKKGTRLVFEQRNHFLSGSLGPARVFELASDSRSPDIPRSLCKIGRRGRADAINCVH